MNAEEMACVAQFLRDCGDAAKRTGCHFESSYDSVYVVTEGGSRIMVDINALEAYT